MKRQLRLWTLQIPTSGVPPLSLAIMAISSNMKAAELAVHQLHLMKGLIACGMRIISSGGDGAAVERDCHRRTASAGRAVLFKIKLPNHPDITVTLNKSDGNIWVPFQDANHGLKTFCNNLFTGAPCLTLGNFVCFYQLVHDLAMRPDGPLYKRDVVKYDKHDDNAASRLFSANTLKQASGDPSKHLGWWFI